MVSSEICITPATTLNWAYDVYGNAVASSLFGLATDNLIIESNALVELSAVAYPVFDIAASAIAYPFRYSDEEWTDLGALTVRQFPDDGRLHAWVTGFVASVPTDTLSLLKDLNIGVAQWITYEAREDEGTQSPNQTLQVRRGSCRDLATLFVEAARSLGFGARIVSGYLYDPNQLLLGSINSGSTHAWGEIYVPGAGWITFDPTNRRLGSEDLIPVAVARDIRQAMPVVGSYSGPANALCEMSVEVSVD